MKLTGLFTFTAIATIIFGIFSVLVPNMMITLFGTELNPAGALMMQFGGAWLIGIGLLAWFVRNASSSDTRRAIVTAYFICFTIGFIVSLIGQINNVLNALGWSTVLLNLVLAVGFGYFRVKSP